MALSGYEYINKKTFLSFILVMNEKEFTFYNLFKVLLKDIKLKLIILCIILEYHR